ncbi:hypothetical protein C8F04DRAFT_1234580 [Mycena alexandri]|uniref:Uncharacterized protein n=1 Tax=Mycena alexandri TaxID=1745969 RepID=A0AAD6SUA1_9AGAR|nr:hypothetical protein C8F04DRAFT_1234580 [Mycena alexandri]
MVASAPLRTQASPSTCAGAQRAACATSLRRAKPGGRTASGALWFTVACAAHDTQARTLLHRRVIPYKRPASLVAWFQSQAATYALPRKESAQLSAEGNKGATGVDGERGTVAGEGAGVAGAKTAETGTAEAAGVDAGRRVRGRGCGVGSRTPQTDGGGKERPGAAGRGRGERRRVGRQMSKGRGGFVERRDGRWVKAAGREVGSGRAGPGWSAGERSGAVLGAAVGAVDAEVGSSVVRWSWWSFGKATWCGDGGFDVSALLGRFVPSAGAERAEVRSWVWWVGRGRFRRRWIQRCAPGGNGAFLGFHLSQTWANEEE